MKSIASTFLMTLSLTGALITGIAIVLHVGNRPSFAQACGGHRFVLTVTDETGRPIRGTNPRLIPIPSITYGQLPLEETTFKPVPGYPGQLELAVGINYSLAGVYRLRVSSWGYQTYEQEIQRRLGGNDCDDEFLTIKLVPLVRSQK